MIYYTHAGLFHADEVFGYAIVKLAGVCRDFQRLTSIEYLPEDGLIADIGRVYDPYALRFDHHQELLRRDNGVVLATAGLLWQSYGHDVLKNRLNIVRTGVHERVDVKLFEGIDTHDADNTMEVVCRTNDADTDIRVLTLPNIISMYNSDDINHSYQQSIAFANAVEFAEDIIVKCCVQANAYIESLADVVYSRDEDIVIFDEIVQWQEFVHKHEPDAMYVVMPSRHPGNPWSLFAMPIKPGSRKLKQTIERPDWFENFIHLGKWIAGCQTKDEAVRLAKEQTNVH